MSGDSSPWKGWSHVYEAAGDLGRAVPLYEQTLADRVRVLVGDHPDTLASRNDLAYAYESAGALGRAVPLYEQTLTDRVRVLGGDHPQTLTARNNLAVARAVSGIPAGDAALVDYWLATPTWGESFAVLDAAEARLRSSHALTDRAEAGDPAAIQHTMILHAVARLRRPVVYAAVTDPDAALAAAADAGNAGRYDDVGLILGLNPAAADHPAGIAVHLVARAAADDPDIPRVAAQLIDAGIAPAILDVLPQLTELLEADAMQNAVPTVVGRHSGWR